MKIGYFHGGRTHLFYRAHINGYFNKTGVNVRLFTKIFKKNGLFEVPASHDELRQKGSNFGRMTGPEIVDEILAGRLDGGTIGEASFIQAIANGKPIVAVANLGHDTKDRPGHAFVLRKGVVIKKPSDFKGKTFTSRRSGPIDRVLTREFFATIGVSLADVKIIDDMPDDQIVPSLEKGKVDGGYYHFHYVKRFVKDGTGYLYRKLDWIDPEASSALLVFHKDFARERREDVQKVVNAYVQRIRFEKGLGEKERKEPKEFGLQMENDETEGMNLPQYDLPPRIRADLLQKIEDLMLKYGEIKKRAKISDFIDTNFVERAMEEKK